MTRLDSEEEFCPKCGSRAGYNHECTLCTGEEEQPDTLPDEEKESHDIDS